MPDISDLDQYPGINEDLIREQFTKGEDGLKYLISLFHYIQRCKNRAETLSLVYQRQMHVNSELLQQAKNNFINEPKPRRIVSERPSPTREVSVSERIVSERERPELKEKKISKSDQRMNDLAIDVEI